MRYLEKQSAMVNLYRNQPHNQLILLLQDLAYSKKLN